MILPALVSLLVAGGPLLHGSWDLSAQCLLHLLVVAGLSLWMLSRIVIGFLPIPSNRVLIWTGVLVALSAASAWSSPVPGYANPNWFVFLQGLWIFPAMAALSKDERTYIDQAIRVSAWVLMVLAFHERFSQGVERPVSALLNENLYAGAVLLLLPLALERGDWLLGAGLVWTLLWTRSAGAWLGLAGALALTQRRTRPLLARAGVAVVLICAVKVYASLDQPEVLDRWAWWKAAWAMAKDRPLAGYGPGTFASVLSAYRDQVPSGLYSLYAHQWYLETAAGFGIPFALVWFGGIWRSVMSEGHFKRFAVIAILLHSLWDYTLSVPGLFWLFCYCAASSIPDTPRGVNIPSPYKPVAAVLVLGFGLALGGKVLTIWAAHRSVSQAQVVLEEGRLAEARERLEAARRLNPRDPERPLVTADVELKELSAKGRVDPGALLAAAASLEEAVDLNPYRPVTWDPRRPSAWILLERVYRAMGRPALAEETLRRAERYRARP